MNSIADVAQKHALSIAIFANYLIFDTILCCIPRFLVLGILKDYSSALCTDPSLASSQLAFSTADTQGFAGGRFPTGGPESLEEIAREWSPQGCLKIVWLAQLTFAAGLVAATILQFVGALCVREYAKLLWMKDAGDGIVLMIEELGDDDEVRETSIWYRDSFEERSPIQAEFKDARESMDEKSRPLV